ncbi:hypothetical protein E1B28_007019 [Marasmius oreades]|uniref:Uncharacterized protein n=1 Tax=Marasmius oreades TaxID=181124 RepID=A0A9P7S0R9_9AGAR|nr:uncharacterized protein E1B28_007019 [Marasmius oreades]KAG7093339.1 hypothetical protein E1B28_007019 [Marasmius oreades]
MWSMQFFGQLCSNLSLSIGLNLLLVMIWRKDGQKLEKWYFIGSILHALIVTLPPVFARAWGVDPLTGSCGYRSSDQSERFRWRMATVLAWPLLDIIGELITFVFILIFMVRSKAFNGNFLKSQNRKTSRKRKYRTVILRIALYPLSAAISVILLVCGDIYTNRKNPSNQVAIVLIPIGYSVRPLLYSLLTILDPSLSRALRTLFNIVRGHSTESHSTGRRSETGHTQPISIATVVSVSHSYPNEYELKQATPPLGAGIQSDKGMKDPHSNDVILPRAPSPTKHLHARFSSHDGNCHDVAFDLPQAAGDSDLQLETRDCPSHWGPPMSHLLHRRSEASEDSGEFLKQL